MDKQLAWFLAKEREYREALAAVEARAPALFLEARARLGMTQAQIAGALGVHRSYVSQIESGLLAPSIRLLRALGEFILRGVTNGKGNEADSGEPAAPGPRKGQRRV